MNTERDLSARDWLLKWILPVILVPLISSGVISYATVRVVESKQINSSEMIRQVQKQTNMNRVEISKNNSRISKLEVICESIDKTLNSIPKRNTSIDKQLREIGSTMAVLKDRMYRESMKDK